MQLLNAPLKMHHGLIRQLDVSGANEKLGSLRQSELPVKKREHTQVLLSFNERPIACD